jgi:sugar diacid utilization regulator
VVLEPSEARDAQSLGEVISRLGPSLLTVAVVPDGSLDRPLTGVSVNDNLLELPAGTGQVLLAVGVDACTRDATDLVQRAATQGYAAVVLHADDPLSEDVVTTARHRGVAILTAPKGVPWVHLATMLRVGIISSPHEDELAGVALGDLFGFSNSLAARIRGAVTIEDPQSHVLAYSSVKDEVDEPRKETILGRQVPQRYMRLLQERGVFRQLLTSDGVVLMDAMPEVALSRRVAISVRAAGELLGSIWVAETGQPLADDHAAILHEAAQTAALHIMRHRMELQAESNLRRSMVRDLLDGNAADVAAVRLGLDPDAPFAVLAFESVGGAAPSNRLLPVVALYCSTFRRTALTLDVGPRVYVVLTDDVSDSSGLRRFADDGARRAASALQAQVHAAVGGAVSSVDQVADSRHDADRVMRVLLRGATSRTVADLDEVRAQANLLEVLDLLRERPHLRTGPLRLLSEEAGDRSEALVTTLRAYLDHFGDVAAASASMQVHPNTFRYRLRRATSLAGLDLDDPGERLMLWLQLRLLG